MKVGEYVAERHGVPEDTDYGVVLEINDDRCLVYDPFRNWQHWVHCRELLPVSQLEFTRTNYPLEDGTRIVHDLAEAVTFAKQSGRFSRRDGQ